MIIKTLKALGYGIKTGARVTTWLMKDDIEKGKELFNKTPYLKDMEFHNPVTINKTKGSK